ncbi:MAG: electron transfer flavoprotein-ubiquinone oxidoreductase, partial [Thermoleophilia bacterium]|nr:electron transfer flavoprotein-ubiquinone oxidoreductase [Thermoleophilia bacterium]
TEPLQKVIPTAGWPLRLGNKYREYGGSWLYPMGEDKVSVGYVLGLDYADARLSAHDLLQEFKSHKFIRSILEGGKRLAWGAKTIPGGGIWGLPSRLHVPGAVFVGDAAGFVDLASLKGVGHAVRSGMLAADAVCEALKAGKAETPAGLWGYDARIKDSEIWKELWRVRNIRPAFQKGFLFGGMIHTLATASMGHFPKRIRFTTDASEPIFLNGRRDKSYPKPDGEYIFDKLSSVFASGNQTRDDQPNHIRIQTKVPRELATMWEFMCPAKVYEVEDDGSDGTVSVKLNPSNCVQCGAITAKGGRLTPPEGGSGPEYTQT